MKHDETLPPIPLESTFYLPNDVRNCPLVSDRISALFKACQPWPLQHMLPGFRSQLVPGRTFSADNKPPEIGDS